MFEECLKYLYRVKNNLYKNNNWMSPNDRYGCIIVKPEHVLHLYHTDIKYHHKMRYIYFPITNEIEDYLLTESNELLIRFNLPNKNDITRFEFNIENVKSSETNFNNEKYQEWHIFNDHHKFIIRINKTTGKGYLILVISREYLQN